MDSQGNRVESQSPFTVTVTYTGDYQTPVMFYLSEDGTVTKLESQAEGTVFIHCETERGRHTICRPLSLRFSF